MESKFQENDLQILIALADIIINKNPNSKSLRLISSTHALNYDDLNAEVKIFNKMLSSEENSFEVRFNYIKNNDMKCGFQNIFFLFKLFLTIPTNTAACERSFSSLRRLKTYLRMTTGQERLSNLALLYIEREKEINKDEIINEFAEDNNITGQRLKLI